MAKKQTKTKGAKKGSKATKAAVVATTPKAPRERVRDPRLPAAGSLLTRPYKGKDHRVTVLDDGFRYDGREFRSLTALAREITGYAAISGPAFFRLTGTKDAEPQAPAAKAPKAKRAGEKATEAAARTEAASEPETATA